MESKRMSEQNAIKRPFVLIASLILLLILSYACEDSSITGSYNQNQAPTTYLTINEVNRSGSDRLSSQIHVSWWGDDPDGYIVGYEYAFNADTNSGSWKFTKLKDSTFVLPIPIGVDTADVIFRIRAIDNDSLRDPSAAHVIFPIKNSVPEIQYVGTEIPSDTTYSVFNFGWQLSDVDGFANINRIEVELNNSGNWQSISTDEKFMVVDIENDQSSTASGAVYFGLNFRSAGFQLDGFLVEQDNQMIIRAIDNAGAISVPDTVRWFIKRKQSRILLLHDYATISANDVLNLHKTALESAGLTNFDLITVTDGQLLAGSKIALSEALPRVIDPTLVKMIAKWDFIYFFSSDLNRNVTYIQEMSTQFRENGGKIFANVPMSKLEATDPLFSFFPMRSFAALPDSVDNDGDGTFDAPSNATNFRLPINRYATGADGWDSLRIKRTISGLAPMELASGATALYEVPFQYQVPSFPRARNVEFLGSQVICAKNAENNIIYFSLDFVDVEVAGGVDLGPLVKQLCVDELGFSSN